MTKDCLYPFVHLYIEPKGTVGPCCAIYQKESNYLIQSPDDLNSWSNNSNLTEIRNHFRINRDMKSPECGQCINHERDRAVNFNGKYSSPSMRESMFFHTDTDSLDQYYLDPKIKSMHIKFGNLCNLACRTCSEESSNLLQKEFKVVYKINRADLQQGDRFGDLEWYTRPGVFEKLLTYVKDINHFHASGGEPLVNDYFWKFIEYCCNNGYNENIFLGLNTNGTVTLKEKQIKMLQSFKGLNIDVSQDATGQLAEYIRTRSSWDLWVKNLIQYKEIIKLDDYKSAPRLRVVLTVSILNVHKLDELIDFVTEQDVEWFYQYVYWPQELCISNLNDTARQYLINKYTNHSSLNFIVEYLNSNEKKELKESTKDYIDRRDAVALPMYKNFKKFKELEPEWYNLL
jgi:MoaA/NifB/PqqE/SkfB family radical SAM enzyme